MTAKQYLNRVRRIDKEIEALLRLVQRTRESLETVTQNYDSDGAQSTKNPHKYDRLVELESLVDEKIDQQIALKSHHPKGRPGRVCRPGKGVPLPLCVHQGRSG